MHKAETIIDLLKSVQATMELVNEATTEEVMSQMSESQLELLAEAKKASSKEELKKMADKLVDLNNKMKNYAT